MKKNRLNIAYKSISIIFLAIILASIYSHKYGNVRRLYEENKKIQFVINYVNNQGDLKDAIIKANDEYKNIQAVIPRETEIAGVIRQLKEKARFFGMEVVSITPYGNEACRDENGNDVKILGGFCKSMPIHLNVRAGYMPLGEFLLDVGKNEKQLIKLSEMTIHKDNSSVNGLNVNIKMAVYLLGK